MSVWSLNRLRKVRYLVTGLRRRWLTLRHGVVMDKSVSLSLSATMISGARGSIVVAEGSLIAFKTLLITKTISGDVRPIRIGKNCFIGGSSTILPGVTIGDGSIVGAGATVFDDVPAGCAVGGNPARILRRDLKLGRFGRLPYADENTRKLYRP